MQWDSGHLLSKAKLFAKYANDADHGSGLYGFWSALYLEILARAALAKIHPSLLANPQDSKSLLFGFGVEITKGGDAVSITTKVVYERCNALISGLDSEALAHSTFMARARNIELHTSEAMFESIAHNRWLTEQFKVVRTLTAFLDADITDFFEREEAEDIDRRIKTATKEADGRGSALVKTCRLWFESLSTQDADAARAASIRELALLVKEEKYHDFYACPACRNKGLILGDKALDVKISILEGVLSSRTLVASKRFVCKVCRLDVARELFRGAEIPATFTVISDIDPVEHFGVDPADYMDTDDMVRHLESRGINVVEVGYDNE